MAGKPDVRVRAHTVYRVDLYDAPRTHQMADGLGMSQANDIAEALANQHHGGHTRMTGSTTSYPVENVPVHLGPLYQELLQLPPGAEFHFRLERKHADGPPVMYLERIVPEVVAAGEQPTAKKLTINFDTAGIQAMIRREVDKLKPTLDDLARDSSLREIKQVMRSHLEPLPGYLFKSEADIEAIVEKVWEKTGKAKADLRHWAYVTLGDKLGEVPLADRRREVYAQHCAHGMESEKAFNAAGWMTPAAQRAERILEVEQNRHVVARIAYLRAQALEDDGQSVSIKDLRGFSSELEFRSAIKGALRNGKSDDEISDHIVAVTSIGNTKRDVIRTWIKEERAIMRG